MSVIFDFFYFFAEMNFDIIDIQHHEHAELYWEFKIITETTTLKI
jgi:hypothetical protein